MSAREIIEQITTMTGEDLDLIAAAVRRRQEALRCVVQENEGPVAAPGAPGRKLSHEEAMDYVFTEFAPVLSRLAQ